MEEIERASERLENIRSVKPILGGLRTISLGSWQVALKRRSGVRDYTEHLKAILPWLVPHLRTEPGILARLRHRLSLPDPLSSRHRAGAQMNSCPDQITTVLVIGSERGLCGRFNLAIADHAKNHMTSESAKGSTIELMTLGNRVHRVLQRRGYEPTPAGVLSMTRLPPFSLGFELSRRWLTAYEEGAIDAADLVYNDYRGTGAYEPTVTRLIPPQLPGEEPDSSSGPDGLETTPAAPGEVSWPPPLIDTDPLSLYGIVVEQWAAVQLYKVLLDSAAAEHSTRFQLMESATQNADQLVEELTLGIQTARRHEITQEMTELATGAGLLDRDRGAPR